jgi:hypothetical protein
LPELRLTVAVLAIPAIIMQVSLAQDPRIMRVLATGEVDTSYCPIYDLCAAEPSLDATLAVAREMHGTTYGERGLRRMIRLYIPRNLEGMLEYDFILINQPVFRYFSHTSIDQMRSAIAEHGVGAMCFMESQYYDIYGPWLETELSKCFPYDHYANIRLGAPGDKPYNLEVVRDSSLPPLMTPYVPLGIEGVKPYGQARPTFEKEGATVWAYCRSEAFSYMGITRFPLFISWEYGPGRALVWTTADQFDSPMWRTNDGRERFVLDIFTGIVWLSSGWDLPEDPIRVRTIRESFSVLRSRIVLVDSLIAFVDGFGANTREPEMMLGGLRDMLGRAGSLYLDHEFDLAGAQLSDAFDLAGRIELVSIELKERALFWVYLIEWLTVMATSMVCGFVLWSLMVRRRLYREVATTRPMGSGGVFDAD